MSDPKIIFTLSRLPGDEAIIISELQGDITHEQAEETIIHMAVKTLHQAAPERQKILAFRLLSELHKEPRR